MKGKLYYRWESELTPEEVRERIRELGLPRDPDQEPSRNRRFGLHPAFWYKISEPSNSTDFCLYQEPEEGVWYTRGGWPVHTTYFSGMIHEAGGKTTIRGTFIDPFSATVMGLAGMVLIFFLIGMIDGAVPVKVFVKFALYAAAVCGAVSLFSSSLENDAWKKNTIEMIEQNLLKR